MGASICCAAADAGTQFTIFAWCALKKQCPISISLFQEQQKGSMKGGQVGLFFTKAQNKKEDSMIKYKWLAVLFLFFLMVQPSFADDSAKIHGIYRLGEISLN